MRIRGYDEETETYSEDVAILTGEIADLTKVASNNYAGVSLFEEGDPDTYRSTYDILQDISEIWDEMTDANQATLLEALFGKRQSNVGAAILSNFEQAEAAMETMENSAGSAEAEMANVIQSLEYKLNSLQETWTGVAQNLISSDLVGGVVDMLIALSNAVDTVTDRMGLLGTAGIAGMVTSFVKLSSSTKDIYNQLQNVGTALNNITFDGSTGSIIDYATEISKLPANLQQTALSTTNLTNAQKQSVTNMVSTISALKEMTVADAAAKAGIDATALAQATGCTVSDKMTASILKAVEASSDFTDAQKSALKSITELSAGTEKSSLSFSNLKASLKAAFDPTSLSGILTIVSTLTTVVSLAKNWYDNMKAAQEEARQAIIDTGTEIAEEQESLQNLIAEYQELASAGDWDSSSREQARSIQEQIAELVGTQADNLDLVNGKLDDEIAKLQQISYEEAKSNQADLEFAEMEAQNEFDKGVYADAAETYVDGVFQYASDLNKLLQEVNFENEEFVSDTTQQFSTAGAFQGKNAQEVLDYWKEIKTALTEDTSWVDAYDKQTGKSSTVLMDYINDQIETYEGIVQTLEDASDNVNVNDAIIELFDVYDITAVDTEEEYTSLIQQIRSNNEYTKEYKDTMVELAQDMLPQFSSATDDATDALTEQSTAYSELSEAAESVTSIYDLIEQAQEDMAEDGGLSADTIQALAEAYPDDYLDYLYLENDAIMLNVEALQALADAEKEATLSAIQTEIDDLTAENKDLEDRIAAIRQAEADGSYIQGGSSAAVAQYNAQIEENTALIDENQKKLAVYGAIYDNTAEEVASDEELILEAIDAYTQLGDAYTYAGSGYESYVNSQEGTSSGALFEEAATAYESLQEVLESGLLNSSEAQGILDFLIPDSVSEQGKDAIEAYAADMAKLFGEEGETSLVKLQELMQEAVDAELASWDEDGGWTINPDVDLSQISEAWTMTEDMALAVLGKLEEYGDTVYLDTYDLMAEKVENISDATEIMNQALEDQSEYGAITAETYKEIVALGDEYTDCLESNGSVMTVNTEKLADLNEELNESVKEELEVASALDKQEWAENAAKILEMESAYDDLTDVQKDELDALKSENKQLASNINQYELLIEQLDEATSGYYAWMNVDSSTDSGGIFDDALEAYEALTEALEDGRTNTAEYQAALSFLVPENISEQGTEAVREYTDSFLEPLLRELEDDETGFGRLTNFLYDAVDAGLASIDEDGLWTINPDITLEDFVEGLNMTEDLVLATIGELNEFDGWNISFTDYATAGVNAIQAYIDALSELRDAEEYGLDSDAYAEALANVEACKEAIYELPDEALIELGITLDEETEEIIQDGVEITADTTLTANDKSDVEQLIQDYQDKYLELQSALAQGLDVDDIEDELAAYKSQLTSLSTATKKAFNIDTSLMEYGIASLTEALADYENALLAANNEGLTDEERETWQAKADGIMEILESIPDLELKTNLDLDTLEEDVLNGSFDIDAIEVPTTLVEDGTLTADVQNAIAAAEDPVTLTLDTAEAESKVDALVEKANRLTDVLTVSLNTYAAQSALDELYEAYQKLKDKTVIVKVKIDGMSNLNSLTSSLKSLTNTSVTVTNKVVTTTSSAADPYMVDDGGISNASGTLGAKKTATSLVGELGPEIVVDPETNTWHTVGDNGPEFQQIKKGQIVFNAAQTEDLLKRGRTTNRGNSFVSGTAYSNMGTSGGGSVNNSTTKITSNSSSSSSSTEDAEDELEEMLEEMREELDSFIDNITHEIFMAERNGGTTSEIVAYYTQIMNQIHALAEEYRALGVEEAEEYINTLEEEWWEYSDAIQEVIIDAYETQSSELENSITLLENWYDNVADEGSFGWMEGYSTRMIQTYRELQEAIHEEAEYYRSLGYSDTSDEVSALSDLWWDYEEAISEVRDNIVEDLNDIVDAASEMLDEVQNAYDTLTSAASEYASNGGFISLDTFQEIISLGAEYMQFLTDENGLLVINEENIQKVIAAKTEQLAIENALAYVERIKLALNGESNESLEQLLYATDAATDSTWGLVYASLELLNLSDEQYQAALHNINAIRALADTAIAGIGQEADTLSDSLDEMADGVDDIVDYVMDMLEDRIEDQIDQLEDLKDAEMIGRASGDACLLHPLNCWNTLRAIPTTAYG